MKFFLGQVVFTAFLFLPVFVAAQTNTKPGININSVVSGKITDGSAPLEGSTVQIKGTTNTAGAGGIKPEIEAALAKAKIAIR